MFIRISPETEAIGSTLYREIYSKESAHTIMRLTSPKICRVSLQAGDQCKSMVFFQSTSEGLRTRRTRGVDSTARVGSCRTRAGLMFQVESENRKKPMSQFEGSQAG